MQEPKLLNEILIEQSAEKGHSAEKLAQLTGVPERFIKIFLSGDYKDLPAAPYARSYVKKIAQALDLDADELWGAYEREITPFASGPTDRLPGNRFAIQALNKKAVIAAVIGFFVLIYAVINFDALLGAPSLSISEPADATVTTNASTVFIRGRLANPKDLLTVNGVSVFVNEGGDFQKEFSLEVGANSFEIIAKRFLGREKHEGRQVIFEPATASSPSLISSPPTSPILDATTR